MESNHTQREIYGQDRRNLHNRAQARRAGRSADESRDRQSRRHTTLCRPAPRDPHGHGGGSLRDLQGGHRGTSPSGATPHHGGWSMRRLRHRGLHPGRAARPPQPADRQQCSALRTLRADHLLGPQLVNRRKRQRRAVLRKAIRNLEKADFGRKLQETIAADYGLAWRWVDLLRRLMALTAGATAMPPFRTLDDTPPPPETPPLRLIQGRQPSPLTAPRGKRRTGPS